ncbi:MAG: hypothetical protein ACD_8C00044G0001 [uncultured bacterium]|nr:MAG: hypothetical protein ACD_8C00044G0001 [uncultured bacterium]
MKDFLTVVKKFIDEKGFEQKLSSFGEANMRTAGRKLAKKEITIEDAINELCKERDYGRRIGRHERAELEKRLR